MGVADTGGQVTTEDRRQSMVHFRSLFEALLGDEVGAATRGSTVEGGHDETDATATGSNIDSGRSAI
jgi:hypothetical protein